MLLNDVLYKNFLSLTNSLLPKGFEDIVVKRDELEFSRQKTLEYYRPNLSEYKKFLLLCEQALQGTNEASLLEVVVTYLSDSDYLNEKKSCEKLLQLFSVCFKNQNETRGIVAMGIFLVDRPKAFVAFLLYLLQHDITPEQILSSHLLHHYFGHYSDTINKDHNPIEKLYDLLSLFPESISLVEIAKHSGSGDKIYELSALNGKLHHTIDSLTVVTFIETPLLFTSNEYNLKKLHAIFSDKFLESTLVQLGEQAKNNVWIQTITPHLFQIFNQEDVVIQQLPKIINSLYENTAWRLPLSRLLNESSLLILMERHVEGLLNLTPFCPQLIEMAYTHDISAYFQALRQQCTSGPQLFSSLFSFFNQVKYTNIESAGVVFESLLDAIHIDTSVLEDTVMIGKLRKFEYTTDWVNLKVRAMEDRLDRIISLQTNASIGEMDCIPIMDVWGGMPDKIRHFEALVAFKTSIPMNEYMLYVRLALIFIQREHTEFDVQAFWLAIDVNKANAPLFEPDTVSPYERFLVELLCIVDDGHVRKKCIQILDEHVNHSRRKWREFNYGDQCLFKKAIEVGNLGLLQWMENNEIKHHYSYDSLAKLAAGNHQWSMVSHFHVRYSLKQSTINMLFETAVFHHALPALSVLWNGEYSLPDAVLIVNTFKLALEKNDLDCIRCLIACPKKPRDSVVKTAFHQAIERKFFDIARAIAEGFSGSIIQGSIILALEDASRLNQCDVLAFLSSLLCNRPGRKEIDNAIILASRLNNLAAVKLFVSFFKEPPSLYVIHAAREEARDKKMRDIECYLSIVCREISRPHGKEQAGMKHVISSNAISLSKHGFFQEQQSNSVEAPRLHRQYSV